MLRRSAIHSSCRLKSQYVRIPGQNGVSSQGGNLTGPVGV